MLKKETQNTFANGLVMDFDPLQAQSNTLVNCLNGTLITHNGNELSLQNDMGNGRVETAYLPEGYVPLGTTELGGIIYIVSYNPLTDRCQIGSFPSPERNITTDETGDTDKNFTIQDFFSSFEEKDGETDGFISSPYLKLVLLDTELNPGDKFQISCPELAEVDYISAYGETVKFDPDLLPRYLKLNVVAIADSGKMTNLNDTLVWQDTGDGTYYYIRTEDINSSDGESVDLDEYRNLIQSNYNVFSSKTSAKLGILAELECVDTFEVTWDAVCVGTENGVKTWQFYLFLNWTYENESSPDKINLYGIRYKVNDGELTDIVIGDYPSSEGAIGTDIMDQQGNITDDDYDTVYYTPYYVDSVGESPDYATNGEITKKRKNDGTDNQYLLYEPIQVEYDTASDDSVVTLAIYPTMPFGALEWLKHEFTIDMSKLGTGEITLEQYKYYNTSEKCTLAWALAAYPERNKEVTSVTFNFYEITNTIYSWIKTNASNFDDDRIVDGSWENGTGTDFTGSTPSSSIVVDDKSSYSGHFTNTFNFDDSGIEWGKTYMVEIEINYNNDEKVIKYYRIYYATTIFNDQYYSVDDFSQIVLNDVLDLSFNYENLSVTNEYHNKDNDYQLAIYDSSGSQVDEIPQTKTEQQTSYEQYYYQEIYEASVDFNIAGTESSGTFDVQIDSIQPSDGSSGYSVETDFSHDSEEEIQTNGGSVTSSSLGLDDITHDATWSSVSVSGTEFSGDLKLSIDIPIQLNYYKSTTYNIQYQQKELEVKTGWLLTNYGTGAARTWYSTEITEYNKQEHVKARDHGETIISAHELFFDENIADELSDCDVLILAAARTTNSTENPRFGWYKGSKSTTYVEYKSNTKSNPTTNVVYVMLDTSGSTVYFTYSGTRSQSRWAGYSKWTSIRTNKWTQPHIPFNLYQNSVTNNDGITLTSDLIKPLSYINKLVEYTGDTKYLYEWSNINYWDTFTWTLTNSVKCDIDISLVINGGVELDSDDDSINNLYYVGEREDNDFEWMMTNRIIMTTYIQLITDIDSSVVYYLDLDGNVLEIEASNDLVNVNGGSVTGILPYYVDSNSGSAKITLKKSGDYVRVSKNSASSCTYYQTASGCALYITGIYLIT